MHDHETAKLNRLWGELIVEELIRNGVDYFCVSPGSRSTLLAAAVGRHPRARWQVFYDERGAAFHALGFARATGMPAVLICTSGTAAANYYPAVIEAAMDGLPLVVLSADRPAELRHSGANQTIHQPRLFGDYPRWQTDLPCPDRSIPLNFLLSTVDQAVFHARRPPAGPVHLNCMFREPFLGDAATGSDKELKEITRWQASGKPWTDYRTPISTIDPGDTASVAMRLRSARRPLLVIGRLVDEVTASSVRTFADATGIPYFADIQSGMRLGNTSATHVAGYDPLLHARVFREAFAPDVVLHLGGQLVSNRILKWFDTLQPDAYIQVLSQPMRQDPHGRVSWRIMADIHWFCRNLQENLIQAGFHAPGTSLGRSWCKTAGSVLAKSLGGESEVINEPAAARLVSRYINKGSGLFLGSSMSVRDMDMFAVADGQSVRVVANRGASGIDGTIASAAGFAVGLEAPVTLVLGDLAFIHDLNSLDTVRRLDHQLIIVLINNGGGGIFSFLPVARESDIFEPLFGMPHDLHFLAVAEQFGLAYATPGTGADFSNVYRDWQQAGTTGIIEVCTRRNENLDLHHRIKADIIDALD